MLQETSKTGTALKFLTICLSIMAFMIQPIFSQEGENVAVEDIKIEFEGIRNVSDEAVMAHIKIKEGMQYNKALVDQSLNSLYDTGLYQFLQVRQEPLSGGGMRLVFVVVPKYRISEIVFKGNDDLSASKLLKFSELEVGTSLDEVALKRATDAIIEEYYDRGFSQVKVSYQIDKNTNTGEGTVTFTIIEGTKIKISDIIFTGNNSVEADDLEDVMETQTRNFISWITGTGRYRDEVFEDDLENLREYYRDQGFLDVEIPQDKVVFDYPSAGKLSININIEEGRQYKIGNISISGNTLYNTEELRSVLNINTGDTFSPSKIDKNASNMKDHYGKSGYLDTYVRAERKPNVDTGNIDLNFSIRESDKFFVESVNIQGNTKTKSIVILRELALAPGDVFDLVRMKSSEGRLRNTGFFSEVNLSPESTNIPNRRNLRITVKEGKTGNITFGAGFSSLERAVVFAEVTQGNFDLFNHRSLFQGDGQKFRLRLSLGSRSNQVLLAFEEPWMFERELAFGFEIFRTETNFNSAIYDELRTGFEVYLRKRLFELVEGRLSYRLEQVEIFDIDDTASTAIKSEAGTRTVSKVGFSMLRDTRDDLVSPSSGSRYQAITEFAGIGGDVDYTRFEGRAGKWWPTFKPGNQVFQLIGRGGVIVPHGSKTVPFFDRYFLGGPNTLRGFDFREVGPKDVNAEPIGGNTFGFISAEYSVDVVDPIRFAVFYDAGFLNSEDNDWSFDDYNDNVGFGFRVKVMGAPLRLDFGFPVTSDDFNDDGPQFNFSFGTMF